MRYWYSKMTNNKRQTNISNVTLSMRWME